MTNLEWLEKAKDLSSLKEYVLGTECETLEESIEIRKTIALEIIAEELILLRQCPTFMVVNNKFDNKEVKNEI